jgi:hypothetical protein
MTTELALSNSLTDLAARIRTEHEAVANVLTDGVQHAMTAGQLLIEAKKQLSHGDWLAWVESNCAMNVRTAQAYMRVARSFKGLGANTQRVAHLSFRDALKSLAKTSSLMNRLPAQMVGQTLDEIETSGDDSKPLIDALRETHMAELRSEYTLENPPALLPAPDAKRKIRVARNPSLRQWMLAIGPSISRVELLQKEQDARGAPSVCDLQREHDDLLARADALEEKARALREDAKTLAMEIDAEIDDIIGPVEPLTETCTFQADKKTDAKLAKLSQADLVERLLAARSTASNGLKLCTGQGDVGYWGDMHLRGACQQACRSPSRGGWTGMGSPEWLEELFGAALDPLAKDRAS